MDVNQLNNNGATDDGLRTLAKNKGNGRFPSQTLTFLLNQLRLIQCSQLNLEIMSLRLTLSFSRTQRGINDHITNNPKKRIGLTGYGLEIIENIPIIIKPNKYNFNYLKTKQDKMGHSLKID